MAVFRFYANWPVSPALTCLRLNATVESGRNVNVGPDSAWPIFVQQLLIILIFDAVP